MSSPRESSPAIQSPASSPGQLTPRSKVKALLASLDKDSDDESVSDLARERVTAILSKPSPSKANSPQPRAGSVGGDTQTDDEEDEIVRPKGRLASRMQVNGDSSDEDVFTEALRRRGGSPDSSPQNTLELGAEKETADINDESDGPVISRKRKLRTGRTETPKSSPAKQTPSPGLFVSPSADHLTRNSADEDSDADLPAPHNARFLALVQKQREQRLAREAEQEKQKATRMAERKKQNRDMEEDDDDISDTAERRFTQPTRKASKKAQEEIRRETQRMSRNQQLAYNAITKKKYAKSDFLAKFNFTVKKETHDSILPTSSSSPAHLSDTEMKETPPTSPASPGNSVKLTEALEATNPVNVTNANDEEKLPSLEDAVAMHSSPLRRLDKSKGRAIEEQVPQPEISKKLSGLTQRPIRIQAHNFQARAVSLDDSDSDLEIVATKSPNRQRRKIDSIFNRIPVKQSKESHSMHALRMLALVKSPPRKATGKNKKPSITTSELQMSLQQRARQQALREREERLQALREKGIIIETLEERERNLADVEDMIAKARREGEEIMKREREAAKKERKANGEADPLGESSDDEDWEEEKVVTAELSMASSDEENEGSEDEDNDASGEEEQDDEEAEDESAPHTNPMFDDEADESDGQEEEEADLSIPGAATDSRDPDDDEDLEQPVKPIQRRTRKAVISDDEDSEHDRQTTIQSVPQTQSPIQAQWESPGAPNSVLRSATKTFIPGVTVAGPAGLGLTQIFAGTMDDSQSGEETQAGGLDFLRRMPAPSLPDFVPTMEADTQEQDVAMDDEPDSIPNSQQFDSIPERIELDFTPSQIHGFDSLVQDSQMSQFPDPTQDVGFQQTTPVRRFVDMPPSTVDTVLLGPDAVPESTVETPVAKKKGKLRPRNRVASFSDDEEAADLDIHQNSGDDFDIATAFDVMRKASKKRKKTAAEEFDKKNSKAKDMVHEQADESEDEYAGLGGASDDESGGEEDELVKEMIDDEGGKDIDERKLAAFFALIEEPNALGQTVDLGSDSEDELEIDGEPTKEGKENRSRDPFALRRNKVPVIDRISLKRQSSSTLSANARLAFSASNAAATFKAPALLRKATTNSSVASTTSTVGMERMAGGSSDGVKRGGGKNSGVNFFARENERKANVVKTEKRREQKRLKGAQGRRKAVGGLLGSGRFD
ncbi:putative Mediator of replication checkpoint protein 1 [Glarea lozoyensis 74030]|uniref:Putative Mediator of replication checkpoint protein 1 n=1 Tax=Glarea lozoyensis (strain ATCC 74030 / MF5533) TaxID=1104152 RepID=H0ESI6_GLAL7|nr:putative Mediator of replication checkpoint protein 1 [Glarea lozoyensis 74030]